ncbi:hypothetical protein QUA13_10905 [Microcoleus sp. S28C3]|uniref:hypothetical protein n=1 Tax=Microcoleus sp. S28C3 TaxID=3055414 RepID=UPI002FD1D588
MITKEELLAKIKDLAPQISSQPLMLAHPQPENNARPSCCFENVWHKVQKDGGDILFGWMFGCRINPKYGEYLMATHHAVWLAPDKHLLDVTPFTADPKHHPFTMNNYVIFLPDPSAEPVVGREVATPLPSKFFALNDNQELRKYVKEIADKEQKECQEILERGKVDPNKISGHFLKPL